MPSFFPVTGPAFRPATIAFLGLLAFATSRPIAPQPAPQPASPAQTAPPSIPAAHAQSPQPRPAAPAEAQPGVSEDQLKQMLTGKLLYLRGGYLDNSLAFNEHGALLGHSPAGSYTLCLVEISKVRLTKRKLELEGVRYGLHFQGALPYRDSSSAVDRVRITPKGKVLKISINREPLVKPKKIKEKPTIQAAPPAGLGAATVSPTQASQTLLDALHNVFADGLDARLIAAMPPFWKWYYQAAAAKTGFRPTDPAVQSQSAADRKARLLTGFQPPSNDYAQAAGVAGIALYHVVIGTDGKPEEIAVARPIGFGLDENAVDAIRKAQFQPAMKNGEPVPVLLDLVVEFRIYSKRTAVESATPQQAQPPSAPSLPGPYSLPQPNSAPQP